MIFSSPTDSGVFALFSRSADVSGEPEVLAAHENSMYSGTFSPDGRLVVFRENHPTNGRDISMLSVEDGTVISLVSAPFEELSPALSPDGNWLAYSSNVSGQYEIYVQPFPGPGGAIPISTDGGREPAWGPPEEELFYISGDL